MSLLTRDSISLRGAGVVYIAQPKSGHRFTLDSILLADFCMLKPRDRVLEAGAGSGIISLLLANKFPHAHITAVELQPTIAGIARENVANNGLDARIQLIESDIAALKEVLPANTVDVIIANPPYARSGAGKNSPLAARRTAREDRLGPVDAWLDLQMFLKNRGRYYLVFPAARSAELMASLRIGKLEPKRVRFVHPYRGKPASLILIEAVKSGGIGVAVLPPLIVHEPGGEYTQEMKEIYGEKQEVGAP